MTEAFERLTAGTAEAKFCFFTDGIDEFTEDFHDMTVGLKFLVKKQ